MPSCSPRLLLAKLHDELDTGRVHFVTARSIDRLRQALHALYSALGGRSSASHAARFNLLADPTGLASTLNLQKRPSMVSIVRKCAPATLQCALVNVWLSKSIWVILVAAPDATLGHGPPNQICPQPLVPRSVKSFAATLSYGTESAS